MARSMPSRAHRAPHHVVRYAPVVRSLGGLARDARVLEVGAGVEGLGAFWPGHFVGADLEFPGGARVANLVPVVADGTRLPFADRTFDLVACVDMLQDVPEALIPAVCAEMARVARARVVLVTPAGRDAEAADRRQLARLRPGVSPPGWLEAQVRTGLPSVEAIVEALAPYGHLTVASNTSIAWHERLSRLEDGLRRGRTMTVLQPLLRAWGRRGGRELPGTGPVYRHRFVLEIQPTDSPPRADS